MKNSTRNFSVFAIAVLSGFIASCGDNPAIENEGPKQANQSDYIGTWESDLITADIAIDKFGSVNKARIPNIVFEMNINDWENVPCEVTFVKEVDGEEVPAEEFNIGWREGMTTYKITGTVTKNNSPYNDTANIGFTQSLYLHHSGYSTTLYIGTTNTDANSSSFYRKNN